MDLSPQDLAALLALIDTSDFEFVELENKDSRITLARGAGLGHVAAGNSDSRSTPTNPPAPASARTTSAPTAGEQNTAQPQSTAEPVPTIPDSPTPAEPVPGGSTIDAPMMGTFYAAPRPGEPPFVSVGDKVDLDTTVGIIEVMKLMTPVPAGAAGTISAVLVANGDLVNFDQALFQITPDA